MHTSHDGPVGLRLQAPDQHARKLCSLPAHLSDKRELHARHACALGHQSRLLGCSLRAFAAGWIHARTHLDSERNELLLPQAVAPQQRQRAPVPMQRVQRSVAQHSGMFPLLVECVVVRLVVRLAAQPDLGQGFPMLTSAGGLHRPTAVIVAHDQQAGSSLAQAPAMQNLHAC